jgi:putative membrane protein
MSPLKFKPILAGLAVVTLICSPVLRAQTADATSNSKTLDSSNGADNNSATTGAPSDQTGTLDKTNSKDTANSLDKNPGTAPTDSATTSATKAPSDASTPADKQMNMDKTSDSSSSSSDSKAMTDQQFLQKAAQGGMTEVELGKLAQQNGSSADVKQFGSRMVTDHSKANADLKSLADKKGVTVPASLDAKHQAMVDRFQHLSGPAFDKAYVHMMVKDHEKDAAEFRQASTDSQDPDVKAFAGDTLKVIESHLSDIKSIQNGMK